MIMRSTILLSTAVLWIAVVACMRGTPSAQGQTMPPPQPDSLWLGWSPTHSSLPPAYRKEALGLILAEANHIGQALHLPERLPIRESELTESYFGPVRYAQETGGIGTISTANYNYSIARANKLCYVVGTHQLEDCLKWEKNYLWPLSHMDTNAAYQLATQWLAAASMDVRALSREYHLLIETDHLYVRPPPGNFVPVYSVAWCKPFQPLPGIIYASGTPQWDPVASVRLFLPTKTLIQLCVEDPKYILRAPVTFTNLDALLAKPRQQEPPRGEAVTQ
jgi:hypothetical protein